MSTLRPRLRFALTLTLLLAAALLTPPALAQPPQVAASSAPRPADAAARRRETFEIVWQTVRDQHYDPTLGGLDWDGVRAEFAPRAAAARSDAELHHLLQQMLNRLGQSHFAIIPPEAIPALAPEDGEEDGEGEGGGGPEDEEAALKLINGLDLTERMTHGVGIHLRLMGGAAVARRVEPESSAWRAGLRPGFVLTRVDGVSMRRIIARARAAAAYMPGALPQLAEEIALGFLNGPQGTTVTLSYLDARNRPRRAALRRERLSGEMAPAFQQMPPQFVDFEARRLRRGVGYIRFNAFALPVMDKFCAALREMRDAPAVVIDLRGNHGGLLGLVHGMGGLLSAAPTSFGSMRTRAGRMDFVAFPQRAAYRGQVVVLVDGSTVSASEIFASGLQDAGRAVVVGERSAGATLPSVTKELPTGAILQYAFADYRTARGSRLEGEGVRPDFEVKLDRRSLLAGRDPQLEAALDAVYVTTPVEGGAVPHVTAEAGGGDGGDAAHEIAGAPPPPKPDATPEREDPRVAEVVEKYLAALGGRAAFERVSSRVSKGTFEGDFAGVKLRGTVEVLEKAPSKTLTLITIPDYGVIRRAFTGEYGYEQMPMFGLREMRGAELESVRAASDFRWAANLRALYPRIAFKGIEKLGEAEVNVLEATPPEGFPTRLYFDARTGLLLRRDDFYFEDYREVDGLRLPFVTRGAGLTLTLREVTHGLPVDDAAFVERKDCFTQ